MKLVDGADWPHNYKFVWTGDQHDPDLCLYSHLNIPPLWGVGGGVPGLFFYFLEKVLLYDPEWSQIQNLPSPPKC